MSTFKQFHLKVYKCKYKYKKKTVQSYSYYVLLPEGLFSGDFWI